MAKKKNDDGAVILLAGFCTIIGILFFLPFLLLVTVPALNHCKKQYLADTQAQRVMDIRRIFPDLPIGCITAMFSAPLLISLPAIFVDNVNISNIILHAASLFIISIILLASLYYIAAHIAVQYFGIVADKDKNRLLLPFDMQSYTISDYFSLRFLHDFCNIDIVQLSSITKLTRGKKKELYVHGNFGSRRIVMSTKQKHDECLAMIQALTGKRGLLITEIEG
jgi:hypothetical protein